MRCLPGAGPHHSSAATRLSSQATARRRWWGGRTASWRAPTPIQWCWLTLMPRWLRSGPSPLSCWCTAGMGRPSGARWGTQGGGVGRRGAAAAATDALVAGAANRRWLGGRADHTAQCACPSKHVHASAHSRCPSRPSVTRATAAWPTGWRCSETSASARRRRRRCRCGSRRSGGRSVAVRGRVLLRGVRCVEALTSKQASQHAPTLPRPPPPAAAAT